MENKQGSLTLKAQMRQPLVFGALQFTRPDEISPNAISPPCRNLLGIICNQYRHLRVADESWNHQKKRGIRPAFVTNCLFPDSMIVVYPSRSWSTIAVILWQIGSKLEQIITICTFVS